MSRAVNAIVIGVAVFVLLAGSIWYVMVAREPNRIKTSTDRGWTSEDGDNFTATVHFANPYDYEVVLERYEYKFRVNGDEWGGGGDQPEREVPPHTSVQLALGIAIPVDAIGGWFKGHVANDERSTVQLMGEAIFSISDRNMTVPFGYKESFSTNILGSLADADACRSAKTVCFAGASAEWTQKDDAVVLVVDANLHNPTEQRADLGNSSLNLVWSGVEVARAETGGGTIDPDGDLETRFLLFFEHRRLIEWWGSHTSDCEDSDAVAQLEIEADFEPVEEPKQSETPTPVKSSPSSSPSNSSSRPPPTSSSTSSPSTTSPTNTTQTNGTYQTLNLQALAEPLKQATLELDAVRTAFVCTHE